MNALLEAKEAYRRFLVEYDAYTQPETETPEEMVYNLEEIKKDIDPDETGLLILLNDALLKFRDAGVRRSEA